MDLKQIKADRANGVIISRCSRDDVLEYAIGLQNAVITVIEFRDGELPSRGWLRDNDASRAALQALADAVYDSTAIGKPKKVTEELSLAARLSGSGLGKPDGGN